MVAVPSRTRRERLQSAFQSPFLAYSDFCGDVPSELDRAADNIYGFPDGIIIAVGAERFRFAEVFFQPCFQPAVSLTIFSRATWNATLTSARICTPMPCCPANIKVGAPPDGKEVTADKRFFEDDILREARPSTPTERRVWSLYKMCTTKQVQWEAETAQGRERIRQFIFAVALQTQHKNLSHNCITCLQIDSVLHRTLYDIVFHRTRFSAQRQLMSYLTRISTWQNWQT